MEEAEDKTRFIRPLAQLMMNCRMSHESSTSAVEKEAMTSFVRRAIHVVKSSETPTLQKAIITADELVKHLASREKPMEISSLEPLALEQFLHESQSQVRAFNAVNWLNKNLQLDWPLDRVEKPCVRDAAFTPSTTESCFCCGKLDRSQCLIDDCNRAILAASLAGTPVCSDLMEQGTPQKMMKHGRRTDDDCHRATTAAQTWCREPHQMKNSEATPPSS